MLSDFKAPKENAIITHAARLLFPWYIQNCARLSVCFADDSLAQLRQLKDRRVVFIFNHPDRHDPLILGALDQHLQQTAHCVVAREVFDWDWGLRGLLFQSLGCYSVNRGTMDLKSFRTTKEILHGKNAKLIVFPEGKITCDNFQVHDLQRSFMHIVLESQAELHREIAGAESLVVVPVATRYELETDIESSFENTLEAIERRLRINPDTREKVAYRIDQALKKVIDQLGEVYGLRTSIDTPVKAKVEDLCRHICNNIGAFFNLEPEGCDSHDCHLYYIRSAVSRACDEIKQETAYQRDVYEKLKRTYKQFLTDLDRVERLLICHSNLEREETNIRVCRTADFLECEVLGTMTAKGVQRAFVNFGSPLQVASYLDLYRQSKSAAVERLSGDTKENLQKALDKTLPPRPIKSMST